MQNDLFTTINTAWNQIRMSGAPGLKSVVPGLTDPTRIMIQRVGESATTLTLMFKGFDQALDNPSSDGPILNRAIFAWIRNFAEAQIVRGGDDSTFSVMVRKPAEQAMPAAAPAAPQNAPMESKHGSLARISSVRRLHG